jgi:uncharacterized oxidoreductase
MQRAAAMTGMREVAPGAMEAWLRAMFVASGCPEGEAAMISGHLVEADCAGHQSHGIVRTPRYLSWAADGFLRRDGKLEVLAEGPCFALLDGCNSFGQVTGHAVVERAAAMAAQGGVAVVAVRRGGHLGRIGAWAERLADRGLISVSFTTVAGSRLVAPFGAAERSMGTNPVTIGIPQASGEHFLLDFATSVIAEGKALVAVKRGGKLRGDAFVTEDGRDSGEPVTLYGDSITTALPNPRAGPGALQAMGDHKGSGLSLACELLAGALTGAGTNRDPEPPFGNGLLCIALDPARFDIGGGFGAEVAAYIASVRALRPRQAGVPVMIPGDPERRRRERHASGLPIEDALMAALVEASRGVGVPLPGFAG